MSPWPHCFWVFGGLFGDGIGVKPVWEEEWGGLTLCIFGEHPLGARLCTRHRGAAEQGSWKLLPRWS